MGCHGRTAASLFLFAFCLSVPGAVWAQGVTSGTVVTTGTTSRDAVRGITVDSDGGLYMTGYTYGTISGASCSCLTGTEASYMHDWTSCRNTTDIVTLKYNKNQEFVWSVQECSTSTTIGTDGKGEAVTTDSNLNVYVTGSTYEALASPVVAYSGGKDVFVIKYSTNGAKLKTTHWGGKNLDDPRAIATDGTTYIYITGYMYGGTVGGAQFSDMFILKMDLSLNLVLSVQAGESNDDRGLGITMTNSNAHVFVAGVSDKNCAIWKYTIALEKTWLSKLELFTDDTTYGWATCRGAASDGSSVYSTGYTAASINEVGSNVGWTDSFIVKFDANGAYVWGKTIGSKVNDYGRAIAIDGDGDLWVTGYTEGSLGISNYGRWDMWVAKYSSSGSNVFMKQVGDSGDEFGYSIATTGKDFAYIGGAMKTTSNDWDFVMWSYVDSVDLTAVIILATIFGVALICCPCCCLSCVLCWGLCCGGGGGILYRCKKAWKERGTRKHFKPVTTADNNSDDD